MDNSEISRKLGPNEVLGLRFSKELSKEIIATIDSKGFDKGIREELRAVLIDPQVTNPDAGEKIAYILTHYGIETKSGDLGHGLDHDAEEPRDKPGYHVRRVVASELRNHLLTRDEIAARESRFNSLKGSIFRFLESNEEAYQLVWQMREQGYTSGTILARLQEENPEVTAVITYKPKNRASFTRGLAKHGFPTTIRNALHRFNELSHELENYDEILYEMVARMFRVFQSAREIAQWLQVAYGINVSLRSVKDRIRPFERELPDEVLQHLPKIRATYLDTDKLDYHSRVKYFQDLYRIWYEYGDFQKDVLPNISRPDINDTKLAFIEGISPKIAQSIHRRISTGMNPSDALMNFFTHLKVVFPANNPEVMGYLSQVIYSTDQEGERE